MSPIPRRYLYQLEANINLLAARLHSLHTVDFTHDEFLALFATEDQAKMLKEVSEIADVNTSGGGHHADFTSDKFTQAFGSNLVHLHFTVNAVKDFAPLVPRNRVILPEAPRHTIDKLTSWIIDRAEINFSISRIKLVLGWLDNHCQTPSQLRFLWPSLIGLCSLNDLTADFGHRLREVRPPTTMPFLPPEVKAACRTTAGTVASTMLLPDPEAAEAPPVSVQITRIDARREEGALGVLSGA